MFAALMFYAHANGKISPWKILSCEVSDSDGAFLLCSIGLIFDTLTHRVLFFPVPLCPFQFPSVSWTYRSPIIFLMINITHLNPFSLLFDSFIREWICFSCSQRMPFISSVTHPGPSRLLSKPLIICIMLHAFHLLHPFLFFNTWPPFRFH